ncbi:hypothetical protein FIBSPDRAFT_957466 [Athelia psychrophila]|uniref:Uncharacterized protein n=1 Tax=Athelia psychrophila TaxID=1759441 RepID=A0A166FT38_9AGAM|nr:hypothetical protein FIBSPDRAFT_957466 [Fibularhizoctonia sp. CBS 109695]
MQIITCVWNVKHHGPAEDIVLPRLDLWDMVETCMMQTLQRPASVTGVFVFLLLTGRPFVIVCIDTELDGVIERLVPGATNGTLITFQDRAKAIKDAWIVPAIPKILAAKIQFLGELDKVLPGDCIIATVRDRYPGNGMPESCGCLQPESRDNAVHAN